MEKVSRANNPADPVCVDASAPRWAITREQFLRGIEAINRYRAMVRAVGAAMLAGGAGAPEDLGGQALHEELTRQIEERCGDPSRDPFGSDIEYMLYDAGGPVIEADGTRRMVNTPELLWRYWEETGRGPFDGAERIHSPAERSVNSLNKSDNRT